MENTCAKTGCAIFLVFDAGFEIADFFSQLSDERGQLRHCPRNRFRRFKLGYGLHGLSQVGAGRFGLT